MAESVSCFCLTDCDNGRSVINCNHFYRFWDDWIRQPEQRKERACIRPELPRTRTFGKIGVSKYV